ncbi:MAG TPA: hypothetical protein VGI22_08080 [Xanthobacteraceae bacterium]
MDGYGYSRLREEAEMQLKAAESRAKGAFQFARDKEEPAAVVDLPNPLRPRRLDS